MSRLRRFFKITLYALLVLVVLVGIGLGYLIGKIHRSIVGKSYQEAALVSVTKYSEIPAVSPPPRAADNPLFQNIFSLAGFANPEVKYRPWVRWWWPGNDVKETELRREVGLFKDHSFGGAEVQPFTIGVNSKVSPAEDVQIHGFDTPSYYQHLGAVMDEAAKQGVQIDLTVGSAWPPAGPQITTIDNLKTLAVGESRVRGGNPIDMDLPQPKIPFFYSLVGAVQTIMGLDLVHFYRNNARVLAVVAARVREDHRSSNPLSLSDQVLLDRASVEVITEHVNGRRLAWSAPPGSWLVMAFYIMPTGTRPLFGVASPDHGFLLDYFDSSRVVSDYNYLYGARTGLPQYFAHPFRSVFNDSFELTAERHITSDFLAYFQTHRGYDVTPYLPAEIVPGYDNVYFQLAGMAGLIGKPKYVLSDADERLRYDYTLTVSDLFRDQFLDPSLAWGEKTGLLSRTQPYGLRIDVIGAAGHIHIPETEALYAGGSEMFLKQVSSGAHLYNRPVISSESFVHSDLDYMTTPQKIKLGADKLFLSGVNHIIYHGTPYRLKDPAYGEPGWEPFSSPFFFGTFSSNISEANPFWGDIKTVNEYIARCQYALRQGKPETEVLVYYPFLGFPGDFQALQNHREFYYGGYVPEVDPLPQASGMGRSPAGKSSLTSRPDMQWFEQVWPLLQKLNDQGLSWEWVNDESLQAATFERGAISIRGNRYGAVLLANVKAIQVPSAENLARLAQQGARVWIYGSAPDQQPGFLDYPQNDVKVASAMGQISRESPVIAPEQLTAFLARRPIPQEVAYAEPYPLLQQTKRRLADGSLLVFLSNLRDQDVDFELPVQGHFRGYTWLDPNDGSAYAATVSPAHALSGSLGPYQSMILYAAHGSAGAGLHPLPLWKQGIKDSRISSRLAVATWDLKVQGEDVPGGALSLSKGPLFDWRSNPTLRYSSSQGSYHAQFTLPALAAGSAYLLSLGKVYFTAEVKLNGQPLPVFLAAPYRADVTSLLKPGQNTLDVTVTPALRNRYVGFANQGDAHYKQFKKKDNTVLPSGLVGPVEVWQIKSQ